VGFGWQPRFKQIVTKKTATATWPFSFFARTTVPPLVLMLVPSASSVAVAVANASMSIVF